MTDSSGVVPVIEGDRTDRPWVKFGGDGFYSVYISECAFAPSLWNVSCVNHIHCFDFWWEFLLFPSALLARLILVFAWCILPLVFGVELAGLLKDPTISVGMVCRLPGSTVDLTYFF